MCLIMTFLAAIVFAFVYAVQRKNGKSGKSVFSVMMCFAAAALMWSVDSIASVLDGEGFFDLSSEDFILGVIIVASGCVLYAVLSLREKLRQ